MTNEIAEAWHFLREDKCLGYGDGREVRPGEWLACTGEPMLYVNGMHGSVHPLGALRYAPGPVVCRVQLRGDILRDNDYLVAQERRVIWMADATETLRAFTRKCVLDVAHLWDAPEVARRYLETGNEALLDAARDAARIAFGTSAPGAAQASAWACVKAVAHADCQTSARDAAWDVAWDAAWAATQATAPGVYRPGAAWGANQVAAWVAAREWQNARLEQMLNNIDNKETA